MDGPDISVIVPVYNDRAGIRATLSALVEQRYPAGAYEVIAVDNGSDDGTDEVIRGFVEGFPGLVRYEPETAIQSSYAARNAGIEAARGPLLAFVDADVTMDETWLAAVCERMASGEVDYLGCAVEMVPEDCDSVVAKYNRYAEFPVERYLREKGFAPTCGLVVRESVLDAVGGFDPQLHSSGDKEFGLRVREAGFTQAYGHDLPVYHPIRSLRELLGKQVRIGRGLEQVDRRHPDRFDHGPLLDPARVLPTVSPASISRSAGRIGEDGDLRRVDLVGLYVLSQVADLVQTVGRLYERLLGGR